MLEDRYLSNSTEEQFCAVAEMVQTLDSTYVENNQAADARTKLAKMMQELYHLPSHKMHRLPQSPI